MKRASPTRAGSSRARSSRAVARRPVADGWQPGLDARTAISGNGSYRVGAGEELLALATCVWRGLECTTFGDQPAVLFAPLLPARYQVAQERRSWTGKAYAYRWQGGDCTLDLRTTLPGPLFQTTGRRIGIRAVSGSEWRSFTDLDGRGYTLTSISATRLAGARAWLITTPHQPLLLVASQPITGIRITTHTYYEFTAARPGLRVLLVPLLSEADVPRDPHRRLRWQALVDQPPLAAEETFREEGTDLVIRTRFPGATLAPIPPMMALLGSADGLCQPPAGEQLLRTWCGPYQVVDSDAHEARIAMGWSRARARATRPVRGVLAPIPEELVYAGDATWAPGTVMDQLLALRTWAPLLEAAPRELVEQLVPPLRVPTPAALRQGVEHIREPTSGQPWGRFRQMWDHAGDAAYDIDWYNGLGLSGLARAVECAVPAIARPAARLARACRPQRQALLAYFALFHDWALCSAWTDPRGWLWNADCLHNGLEGILAEVRLREREGNHTGASFCRFLAGRQALGLRASFALPAWLEENRRLAATPRAAGHALHSMVTWSGAQVPGAGSPQAPLIGVQAFTSWRDLTCTTTQTRNPYVLAGHHPEWNQLLRQHTSTAWQQCLRAAYDAEPARTDDWIAYYIGSDWQHRRRAGDQEARIEAATFYHAAPEVAFRRFVLQEDPDRIEGRFRRPLGLAEQLFLRAGFALADAPQGARAEAAGAAPPPGQLILARQRAAARRGGEG